MTSVARFFVKHELHEKCGVFSMCKKVTDFFDTLKNSRSPNGSFSLYQLFFRITSWLPPSTMLTEDTSVSFASRFRSERLVTPQLHMVDFIL